MNEPNSAAGSARRRRRLPDYASPGPPAAVPQLHSIKTVCDVTTLSRNAVYDRMKSGMLNYVKIGRRTLVTDDQLRDFIDRHRHVHPQIEQSDPVAA